MSLYEKLIAKEAVLAVVGLGYVGMPIAVAFAKKGLNVIGFDTNSKKIEAYRSGADPTKEVGDEQVRNTTVQFTDEEQQLRKADFIVVAVPTPVNFDHTPDLTPVIGASEIVGRNLKKGAIVVYESTVYPGCTENVCIPILEKGSGMVCGTISRSATARSASTPVIRPIGWKTSGKSFPVWTKSLWKRSSISTILSSRWGPIPCRTSGRQRPSRSWRTASATSTSLL